MSPQAPLVPPNHPLLAGGYSKAISLDSLLLAHLQWVFCVALCNIRLYKLSTLSLRLFPPLKPFERRDQSTDIHDDMGRTQAHPQLTSIRYARNTRLYRDMWFEMHRSPCRQERSESRVGRAGVQSPPGGLLHHSPYRQERSESREGGVGGRSPSEGVLPKCWLFTVTSVIVFCGASPV